MSGRIPTKDHLWNQPAAIASEALKPGETLIMPWAALEPGEMLIMPADPWAALTPEEQNLVRAQSDLVSQFRLMGELLGKSKRAAKVKFG